MTKYFKFSNLVVLIIIFGCNGQANSKTANSSNNATECQPYFTYDKIEHYYINISEEDIWKIQGKKKQSGPETQKIEFLIGYNADKLADTITLKEIENIGFVKHEIPKNKFEQLDQIFCERKHKESTAYACIPVYRDILIFKERNKIIGAAKLCFECNQNLIIGTSRNTAEFGQSGDYKNLYNLLH